MDKMELEGLMEDLRFVKGAVRKHDRLMREIALPRHLGPLSLYFGSAIAAASAALHGLTLSYGSYAAVPAPALWLLWGFVAFSFVAGGIMKMSVLTAASRAVRPGLTPMKLFFEFFSGPVKHFYLPALTAMAGTCAYAVAVGRPWYVLPTLAVGYGLMANTISTATGLREYLVLGYWLIGTGLASLASVERWPFVWLGLMWGLSLVAFGLAGIRSARRSARAGAEEPGRAD